MKSSSFIIDLIRVTLTNGSILICGLLTSIITARYLGPEKNGIIASILVFPQLFMTVGSLGIRQSSTYYLGKKIFTEGQIKTSIVHIWIFSSILCVISSYFLIKLLSNQNDLLLIFLAIAPIPFSLFNTYNSGIFLGKNQIKKFNKVNWIPPFIILIATVFLLIFFNKDIGGYLFALILGPLSMFIILLFYNDFIHFFKIKLNYKIIWNLVKLGMVYATALLVINLNYRIDIILLENLSTPFELGIYSKGANITQYLWQIPALLSTIVFARSATSRDKRGFSKKVIQLLRVSFIIVSIAACLFFILSHHIILFLFGEEFEKSSVVVQILLFGVFVMLFFKILNMDLAGRGKPWIAMKAMLPGLIVNIVLNFNFIPQYGANGAAYASTISYTVAALLFTVLYAKETNITLKEMLIVKKSDFEPITNFIKKINT